MGINRFSTTGTTEYTPQHVPLPFDTITKMGEQVKLEHDTADAAAAVAKTDIQGGLATQEHAKALNAKKNTMLQEAQARAEKTNNYGRLTQDIKEIASAVQNDPLYQGIQRDIAQTKRVNEQRADPNLPYVVQNYADEKSNVKQLGIDQPFDESYYNQVAPGDRNAERKPLYAQIKPIISRIYSQPVTKTWIDEMGREHTQTLQEGVEAEGLRRDQVKATLADYIKKDPNALYTPSFMYDKARLNKQGLDWTPEQELDATANAFLGEYYNEKEIQKLGADKVTSPLKDASGGSGGGSGKVKEPIPNAYTGMLDTKTVVDEHLDGLFRKNEDGTHTVPLKGSIMNFAKVSGASPEEDKILTWGQQISKLKNNLNYNNDNDFIDQFKKEHPNLAIFKTAFGQVYISSLGKNRKQEDIDLEKKYNATGNGVDINTLKNDVLKSNSNYQFLKESAKQQGLDIDSPQFQQSYLKGLGKYSEEINGELGKILEIGGEAKFIVDQGENKINVDGKPFLSGQVIMTKTQLNAAFEQVGKDNKDTNWPSPGRDEWEEIYLETDGAGYGSIHPYSTDPKTGEALFAIDIKKEIPVSRAINKTYNKNVYSAEYTSNADNLDKSYDEFVINKFRSEERNVYSAMYTNNKKVFDENLNKQIKSNDNYKPQLDKILADINAEKDPDKKKEALIQFSLNLKNGDAEYMVNNIKTSDQSQTPAQPASGGKSQGGWSQTPATPLKK